MTSAELRRIVGAMTERPWRAYRHGSMGPEHFVLEIGDQSEFQNYEILPEDDATAVAILANHADALVALVEACEVAGRHLDLSPAVQDALDAVHAVRGTP